MQAESSGGMDTLDTDDVDVKVDMGYGRNSVRNFSGAINFSGGSISLNSSGQEKVTGMYAKQLGIQLKYQEKGAKKGDILNYENSLLDRFKDSGIDPEAKVNQESPDEEISNVINNVDGLKDLYNALGSPEISFEGRSSNGYRGFTNPDNSIDIYNKAFDSNFWLASTIFHELVHVYQNLGFYTWAGGVEVQAYRVEWKLADKSLKEKYYEKYKFVWQQISDNPYPYNRKD